MDLLTRKIILLSKFRAAGAFDRMPVFRVISASANYQLRFLSGSRSSFQQNSEAKGVASSEIDEFQPLDIIRSKRFQRTGQRKKRERRELPPPR